MPASSPEVQVERDSAMRCYIVSLRQELTSGYLRWVEVRLFDSGSVETEVPYLIRPEEEVVVEEER